MEKGTQQTIGWSGIVIGILVILNQYLSWPGELQYLWGLIVLALGAWVLTLKK